MDDVLNVLQAAVGIVEGGADFPGGQGGGGNEDIFNIAFLPDIQPDFPVQPAVGQVINDMAEGGNLWVFRGIQPDSQQVIPAKSRRLGDLHPEAGIAAAVLRQFLPVYVNCGDMGRAVKLQENVLPCQLLPQIQFSPIAADALIGHVVGVVQRQLRRRVGQADSRPRPFSQSKPVKPFRRKFPFIAKTEHFFTSDNNDINRYFKRSTSI